MDKLNEDFTKLYKRWKGGSIREEDKIDKAAVSKFMYDYDIDEDKVTIHETCVDYDGGLVIGDTKDLTFKFGKVSGCFDVSYINLKDLEFMPKYVGDYFNISSNDLKSFKGCPEEVVGNFTAVDSRELESLEGLPKHIGGNLLITTPNTPGKFTEDDIPEGTVVDGEIRFSLRRKNR